MKKIGHREIVDTDIKNPCKNCMDRIHLPCSWCIEHDCVHGRFEQAVAKLSVLDEPSRNFVIEWIEHCRQRTENELKNLTNSLMEIYKHLGK